MRTLLPAILLVVLGATGAGAASADLAAPIHQFVDSFNKGDIKTAEAAHSATGLVIIDEMPPYQWQGPGAFKSWLDDLTKYDAAGGVTDGHLALGELIREESSGDHAYVVMTAVFSFKANGAPMREAAQMTFALRKEAPGWRIGGWTFAGSRPTPGNP